jgi:hypothetical protein
MTFTILNVTTADDGAFTFTVAGATVKTVSVTETGDGAISYTIDPSTYQTVTVTMASGANTDDYGVTIVLNKLATGKTATINVDSAGADDDDGTATIKTIAATQKNVVSASKSNVDVAGGLGAAVGGVHYVTWDITDGTSAKEIAVDVDNVYDASLTIEPLITASVTGPFSVAVTTDNTNCDNETEGMYASTATGISDGDNQVCLIATDYDETSAGKGTLTVSAGGVTLKTASLNMLGQVTKIVPTQSMMYWADGGSLDGEATFAPGKLTYYDAANNNLNLLTAEDGLDAVDAAVTFEQDGVASTAVSVGDGSTFGDGAATDYYLSYNDICASTDYESGDKTVIQAFYENEDETEVASASWTVTCTDADGIITKLAMAAGSANPSSDVKVLATVTDSEGLPCGYGCVVPNVTTLTLTPEGDSGVDELAQDDNASDLTNAYFDDFDDTISDGSAYVKVGVPSEKGSYAMILEYDDVTAGDLVEGSWTLRVASANVSAAPSSTNLTAGAKKLTATADFGATAGGAKIAFTLERSNGTVKTYYRKANADGVAKFTLRFRGTYEVTASFGDYITDTVILRKR